MSTTNPMNHDLSWTDLLKALGMSSATWWQIVIFLYGKEHGYSNYVHCLKRGPEILRRDVYNDPKVRKYLEEGENNRIKVDGILDEMCHLLDSQTSPSRRLKIAGVFFLKCITKVYSSIYVNKHLFSAKNGLLLDQDVFKKQYLSVSKELPVVILPTHRSYMDFLFISYIMTHYELPLPIVATGDNFKALGKLFTNYLKSTGAFILRRNAQRKKDIEANVYHDILRAYVHSTIVGGENPIEFFMEGTRTRVGQVLKPKTGLLSMIVDGMIDHIFEDVYILPVTINYQRPIEEQLFIAENTPEIDKQKPKESAQNLITAFETVMRRHYGKVYVRFLQPFKLSSYFAEWKRVTNTVSIDTSNRENVLHMFTNSLASKVCLLQANNNVLMPFNLMSCSLLSRSFLRSSTRPANRINFEIPIHEVFDDFQCLEDLLKATQDRFLPGWNSKLEIFEEFKLNRDKIIRATSDHRYIEFNEDALTFQTMLYYSNQVIQMVLPVSICSLLGEDEICWTKYKTIRNILAREFFANESFMELEYREALKALQEYVVPEKAKILIGRHLIYFVKCYLKFFRFLDGIHGPIEKSEFFQQSKKAENESSDIFISKDLLKNMVSLVTDEGICRRTTPDDKLEVIQPIKLKDTTNEYQNVEKLLLSVLGA